MVKLPNISAIFQRKHVGESIAIYNGDVVAVGQNSFEAEQKAIKKGFPKSEIMTTSLMGKENYVL